MWSEVVCDRRASSGVCMPRRLLRTRAPLLCRSPLSPSLRCPKFPCASRDALAAGSHMWLPEGETRTEFKAGHYLGKTGEDYFESVFEFQRRQEVLKQQPDSHSTPQQTGGIDESCRGCILRGSRAASFPKHPFSTKREMKRASWNVHGVRTWQCLTPSLQEVPNFHFGHCVFSKMKPDPDPWPNVWVSLKCWAR